MPKRPPRPCKHPGCSKLSHTGYCEDHVHAEPVPSFQDRRVSSARRGYGREWRRIRARVLARYGIPRSRWHLYDVDHRPAYDPVVEPDHRKYDLVPMLRADHSRKTVREDGGLGNDPTREGRVRTSQPDGVDRGGEASSDNGSKGDEG